MPYASPSDLPSAIRSKYSEKCQRAFVGAFNSTYEATDGDEGRSFASGHAAAKRCQGTVTAAEKQTKAQVNYRQATGEQRCGNCSAYSDGSCSLVAGDIAAAWTCDLYAPARQTASEKLADHETRRFWAGNNVPGKKGFQPKAKTQETPASAERAPAYPGTKLSTFGTELRVSGKANESGLRAVKHPNGEIVGYVKPIREPVMSGAIQVGTKNGGFTVHDPMGSVVGTASTLDSAKYQLAGLWNENFPKGW